MRRTALLVVTIAATLAVASPAQAGRVCPNFKATVYGIDSLATNLSSCSTPRAVARALDRAFRANSRRFPTTLRTTGRTWACVTFSIDQEYRQTLCRSRTAAVGFRWGL